MPHIEEGQLHALLDGAYGDSAEGRAINAHLSACADCRAVLESERAVHVRANALLELARPLPELIPPFEAVVARAKPTTATRFSPARLAWAASLIMALGLGWFGRDLTQRRGMRMTVATDEIVADSSQSADAWSGQASAQPRAAETETAQTSPPPAAPAVTAPGPAVAEAPRNITPPPMPTEFDLAANRNAPVKQQSAVRSDMAKSRTAEESGRITGATGAAAMAPAPSPAPPPALAWHEVSLESAERTAGRRVLLMPGFELVKLELQAAPNGYAIRALQRIPGDGTLELTQEPSDAANSARERRAGISALADAANSSTRSNVATLQVGELRITARATLSVDSLRVLLGRLR